MDLIAALKRVFFTAGSSAASEDSRVPILDANGNAIGSDKMTNILGAGSLLSAAKSIVSALTSRTGTSTTAAQGQNLYVPLYNDSGEVVNKIAITELAAFAAGYIFASGNPISSGSDLNDLTEKASYYSDSNAIVSTLINKPSTVTGGFLLLNIKPFYGTASYMTQIIVFRQHIFVRYNFGTAASPNWKNWQDVAYVN